jgi:hypothetical protein
VPIGVANTLLVLTAVLSWLACSGRVEVRVPKSVGEGPRHPVTVHLSNQSYREPFVRLSLELDGQELARPLLFVGFQHTRRDAVLELPEGSYRIAVSRPGEKLRTEAVLEVRGPRWASAAYWNQQGQEPSITLEVSEVPIGFD